MRCTESMRAYPEFTCNGDAVWVVVYTGTDDEAHTRYTCSQHLPKAMVGVEKVKKPNSWPHVVSKRELLAREA